MLTRLVFIFATSAAAIALSGSAQATSDITLDHSSSDYSQDSRGTILRNSSGLCWRTGTWVNDSSITGCDGALVSPIAKPTAPAIRIPAEPTATALVPPAKATRCDFVSTLEDQQTFAFGRAILTDSAKDRLSHLILRKLSICDRIESILIVGHTDRIGSVRYNQLLSLKRAEAVATYLKSKGISAQIHSQGAGSTKPIHSCPGIHNNRKLIECLTPNRRVTIEIRGLMK